MAQKLAWRGCAVVAASLVATTACAQRTTPRVDPPLKIVFTWIGVGLNETNIRIEFDGRGTSSVAASDLHRMANAIRALATAESEARSRGVRGGCRRSTTENTHFDVRLETASGVVTLRHDMSCQIPSTTFAVAYDATIRNWTRWAQSEHRGGSTEELIAPVREVEPTIALGSVIAEQFCTHKCNSYRVVLRKTGATNTQILSGADSGRFVSGRVGTPIVAWVEAEFARRQFTSLPSIVRMSLCDPTAYGMNGSIALFHAQRTHRVQIVQLCTTQEKVDSRGFLEAWALLNSIGQLTTDWWRS